jgi:phosphoribosylformimino-5-aminoimidazole carboxamide ribotide isomerase
VILLPAIDIRDGRAVRLRQGDFADETVYADDPLDVARDWVAAGARALHVVDLDGARRGEPASLDHLRRIAGAVEVPVQYGGGLRTTDAVGHAFEAGAERVVLGTAALTEEELLDAVLERHGEAVSVAIDVRGGHVSVSGWTEEVGSTAEAAVARLEARGVRRFVYTDVERDGMLEGPDLDAVRRVGEAVAGRFLCSGGVGSIGHLAALRSLGLGNLEGVISGKALYEGRFTVAEGQAALDPAAAGA